MANKFLKQLYKNLYDEDFSYDNFEHRLKMQKGIYLLQEMGVPVGDYNFSWYKFGPYSQRLQDDAFACNSNVGENYTLTEDNQKTVDDVARAMQLEDITYTQKDWAECLGSIQYLKKNIMPSKSSDEELLEALEEKKKHLNNRDMNKRALDIVNNSFHSEENNE